MQDIIAVIFDFDDTLAPDSTSTLLDRAGVDVRGFWQRRVQPLLDDGWDPVPAYLYMMLEESNAREGAVTRDSFIACGRELRFYRGATRIFSRLRKHVHAISPNVSLEFYLISSGIGETLRASKIAREFTDAWACDFHYGDDGRIVYPKNIVSFTDKTRFIFQIHKGIVGPEFRGRPFAVNKKVRPEEVRVPFNQMVFVGDGYTDIPCFSMLRKSGGTAIGVYDRDDREKWGRAWGYIEDDRVSNLVPGDYSANSALSISLMMAAEHMAKRIELRNQTYQG